MPQQVLVAGNLFMENLKFAKLVKKTRQIEGSLEKFDFPKLIGTHRSTLSITYELEGLSDSSGKYAHKQENEQRWSQTHCRYDSQWSTLNAWKDQKSLQSVPREVQRRREFGPFPLRQKRKEV